MTEHETFVQNHKRVTELVDDIIGNKIDLINRITISVLIATFLTDTAIEVKQFAKEALIENAGSKTNFRNLLILLGGKDPWLNELIQPEILII